MISPQDVFQQCHEHLRIAEQRRDIAVGVLVTFVLAVLAVLREGSGPQFGIRLAFTIIAVGTFTLLGLYRRWKLIHLHAASVFMKLSRDDTLRRAGRNGMEGNCQKKRLRASMEIRRSVVAIDRRCSFGSHRSSTHWRYTD